MRSSWRQINTPSRHWRIGAPSVVAILIALNVAFFVFEKFVDSSLQRDLIEEYLALSRGGIRAGFYWQFVTYTFVHGSVLHLLANMIFLYFAGREILFMLGTRNLLAIYFTGGIAGGIAQFF